MNNDKPLYVGSGKEIHSQGRDPFISIELDLDDLREKLNEQYVRKWKDKHGNERRVVKLVCSPLRPENRSEWKTHSIRIDTWIPDKSKSQPAPRPETIRPQFNDAEPGIPENVPF